MGRLRVAGGGGREGPQSPSTLCPECGTFLGAWRFPLFFHWGVGDLLLILFIAGRYIRPIRRDSTMTGYVGLGQGKRLLENPPLRGAAVMI